MSGFKFSFIIPTRQRTHQLRQMLDSVRDTTHDLSALEIILVVDTDDRESIEFSHRDITLKHVRVPPGLSMGALNMAGYGASSGHYLMLVNDDVILQTPGWDQTVLRVFEGFSDGVCLVNVNDLIFRDTLCTFPCLPRSVCELAGGICPSGYIRYRIDDHIHNVFDLLAILGVHRRIFLPDVVFEHTNAIHHSHGVREYTPDPAIQEKDTRLFDSLLPERRKVALSLLERIESRSRLWDFRARTEVLDAVTDSVAVRRPEYARWIHTGGSISTPQARVTIGLISPDLKSMQARHCIELIRAYTANYDLIAVDHNRGPEFNPGSERNRILSMCRADYLVLMDDSAFVEPGWLEKMLGAIEPSVGAVTTNGILLVDVARCGHLRFDETKTGPALGEDYACRARGEGFRVAEVLTEEPIGGVGAVYRGPAPSARTVTLPHAAEILRLNEELNNYRAAIARLGLPAAHGDAAGKGTEGTPALRLIGYPLFDADYYREQNPDIAATGTDPFAHFLEHGSATKCRPNPLFDSQYYLLQNPDVAAAGDNPLVHFVEHGSREGRRPHPLFDPLFYVRMYPDVAQSGINPLAHFLEFGAAKGYSPCVLFDTAYYLRNNADVAASGVNPLVHFLERGAFESRNPNPYIDTAFYLSRNPDLAAAGVNPLVHFVEYGAAEDRNPNPLFDVRCYRIRNPDVETSGMNPLEHFLAYGIHEQRSPSPILDLAGYLARFQQEEKRAPFTPRSSSDSLAPLSVVLPTQNRAATLMKTLEACRRHGGGCEIEFIVIDDGSTDDTVQCLGDTAAVMPNLSWKSVHQGGPGRARNIGVNLARHDVILFLGDDIRPINDDFFRVHASLHAAHPETDFAVLGKVVWPCDRDFPVNQTMVHIQQNDGSQFDYPNLTPYTFTDWRHFYTSNLSLKKHVVHDWIVEGFDTGFPGAALEDMELAYRVMRSPGGLRLFYDPGSVGAHYHHYTVTEFMARQLLAGKSLKYLVDLHPDMPDDQGIGVLLAALKAAPDPHSDELAANISSLREALKAWARILEGASLLGQESWHNEFLSALFELCLHEGFVSAWPQQEINTTAASAVILDRFLSRVRPALQHEIGGWELLKTGMIPQTALILLSLSTEPRTTAAAVEHRKKSATYKLAEAALFENELQPWRTSPKAWSGQLHIPSMICSDEVDFLHYLARRHFRGKGVIVEFGPLAGASTYAMASGAPRATIHCYDFWKYWDGFTVDCFPGKKLRHGDDVLPLFLENVAPYRNRIVVHQGELNEERWYGEPIEILFIDAAKNQASMLHMIREFYPSIVPGGWIIYQDYVSATCPWIHIVLEELNSYFEYFDSPSGGSIVTRVVKPIPRGVLPRSYFDTLPLQRARSYLQNARNRLVSWEHLCVWLAEADYLACSGQEAAAREIMKRVKEDPRFDLGDLDYDLKFVALHIAEHAHGIDLCKSN